MTTLPADSIEHAPPQGREVSGTAIVLGMLALGIAATTVMYVYWDLHTKPFRPLTEAIGRTFKHSLPKVEGGRHKQNPMTLRVSMRVPYSPEDDDPQAQETLRTVFGLIHQHQNLTGYEVVEIHLLHVVPEAAVRKKSFRFAPEEIR